MFGKNTNKSSKMDTIIGKNTKLEGKIEATGTVRLDGELNGDLIVDGSVIIGKKGVVKGNITCTNIFVSGIIEGNIDAKEQLRLTNTAQVFGDIVVKTFIVDENAVFEGKCRMQNAEVQSNSKSMKKSEKKSSQDNRAEATKGA